MSLHRLFRLLILAIILAAAPALAQETPSPASLKVQADGGFSGWAVPLPDYAAHVVVRGEIVGGSARMVYGDVSLTPLRVSISGNAAATPCTVTVTNRTTTLRLPAAGAFLVEPSADAPDDQTPDACASLVQHFEVTVPAGGGVFWFPVPLYPQPSDLPSSGVEVEVQAGNSEPLKASAAFRYLPRGRMYVCLLEAKARGALAAQDIGQVVGARTGSGKAASGFNQKLQLISTPPDAIGPDHRVLRHFAYIAVSAKEWEVMPARVQGIVADATALGGRLVIFSANGAVTLGKRSIAPSSSLLAETFGYGEVSVTTQQLEQASRQMSAALLQQLKWAHVLGLGLSGPELGEVAQRDILYRLSQGQGFSYAWMISMSDVKPDKRGINPAWAYSYITRAGMLHPLDSQEFHWRSVGLDDVSRELVEMSTSTRDSRPIHWVIDYNLRRSSARALSNSAVAFTLLILALAAGCFVRRCRYVVLAAFMFIVSAALIGLYALRIDAFLPGSIKGLELSSTIGGVESESAEVRSIAYAYSAYSTDCKVTEPASGAVLTRIAPLQDDSVGISAGRDDLFTLEKLHLEPLLPTEFCSASVARGASPVQGRIKAISEDEDLLEITSGTDQLSFVFLVDGTRVLYIGEIPANASRTIVVPAKIAPLNEDVGLAVIVARNALESLYGRESDSLYSGDPSGLRAVGISSQADVIYVEVLRQLIAEGRGITLVGLRAGPSELRFGRNSSQIPKVDLFIYKLK